MIVVDSSALIAILLGEPEAEKFVDILSESDAVIPASVLVEANIVALNRGLEKKLQKLLETLSADIAALDEVVASAAITTHKRFGKARHKANLNFGDCLAYATAKTTGLPLLFKGDDFSRTDVPRLDRRKH